MTGFGDDQKSSHEWLAAIVASADDAVIGKDVDGRIRSWNDGAERMFGYAAHDIIGESIFQLVPFDRVSEEVEILKRLSRGERIEHFETQRVARDGRIVDVSATFSPIVADDGSVCGVSTIARDVTERKRTDAAVGRLAAIVDSSSDAIIGKTLNGVITSWNRAAAEIFGYTSDEVISRPVSLIIPADRLQEEEQVRATIAAGQRVPAFATQRQRKDGTVLDVSVTCSPIRDGRGVIIGISSIIVDQTEARRRESAMREAAAALQLAEERMRFALEASGTGTWDLDYATGILTLSPILERQCGLVPGSFAGTFEAFLQCVHPDDRALVAGAQAAAMASGQDVILAHRVQWSDGTVRWLRGAGRVHRDARGTPTRAVGISLDITDQRALEAQFHHAQKMEALGRLAGGVAHDFNNLLTVTLGHCELLLSATEASDPKRSALLEIQTASKRAAGLTAQLLGFSRRQVVQPTRVDLNELIASMTPMLQRLVGEDVRVITNLRQRRATVVIDRSQAEQIVMNLVVNGRDAMPKGGRLTLETERVELDPQDAHMHPPVVSGVYVAIRVTDTGMGMTAEVQQRLFEPYFTTKAPGKGTGLGMATVHQIVSRYNGRIVVYSELGHGTAIHVYLPSADAPEPDADHGGTAPVHSLAPTSVLVVEDEDMVRQLVQRLLERDGHSVGVASSVAEARRLFAERAFALVITDVVLTDGNGSDLAAELLTQHPSLKIVYMSGYTEQGIRNQRTLPLDVAFIQKPFTADTLRRTLAEAMARPDSSQAAATSQNEDSERGQPAG